MNVADEIRKIEEELRGIKQRLASIRSGVELPAHHTNHELGGSDFIKLDDLATPDDNTDLDASITEHGLLRKLDNNNLHFLDGQGGWTVPAGGGAGRDDYSWESVRCPDRYFSSNVVNDPMGSMSVLNKDKGYAMPFLVPCQQSFDKIGIVVQIAGDATSKIRLGIYTDDGQAYPDALVVDSGELTADTNGFKEVAIDELLDAGLYWLVCNSNGDEMSSLSVKTFDYWRCMSPLGWPLPIIATIYAEYFYTKDPMNYAALPDPFPAGAIMTKDTDMRAIFLRKKNAIP